MLPPHETRGVGREKEPRCLGRGEAGGPPCLSGLAVSPTQRRSPRFFRTVSTPHPVRTWNNGGRQEGEKKPQRNGEFAEYLFAEAGGRVVRQGARTPSQPPCPSERPIQAACCATPRAGRASGQRRLPRNPHPNPHPNPQSRWPSQPPPPPDRSCGRGAEPGARPLQPGPGAPRAPSPRAGAPGPCPGPAPFFCFRTVPSLTLNPGGVPESPAVIWECLAPQRSKRRSDMDVSPFGYCLCFPFSSPCFVFSTCALIRVYFPKPARYGSLHTCTVVSTYKIKELFFLFFSFFFFSLDIISIFGGK
ncbi:basic proline-rich protein-like isoform X2 [Motacilla alba alba]|uniref:basic proline-rich protein-like isoform X2 n=1 Tax=Motacilla alba alba TaxID=1094192 RepID=UPI0018D536BC|nr:basic proline-rich protein-like isoform X2 [Motacilla alba alba]